jgi:hypothetical protein
MDGAIFIRWGRPVPGREAKGLEVLAAAQSTYDDLAKAGRIREHREYFAINATSGGCMIVEGEIEELAKLMHSPEQLALNVKASAVVEDFTTQLAAGGTDQGVQNIMGIYMQAEQELGYL